VEGGVKISNFQYLISKFMARETFDPWEESEQKEKGLRDLYEEAARNYEETLGVPPPRDWKTEQITAAMEKESEKEKMKRAKERGSGGSRGPLRGLPQFDEAQGVVKREVTQRGERSARKRRKPGRETIREKKAA
jgi:hypothetical protein